MNCSITKNYLSEKARLCSENENTPDCRKCPLSHYNNGHNILCTDFEWKHPEETMRMIQNWSDSHPCKVKTYLEDFLEKFPNTKLWKGRPRICVSLLYGVDIHLGCTDCTKCWNRPMERNERND